MAFDWSVIISAVVAAYFAKVTVNNYQASKDERESKKRILNMVDSLYDHVKEFDLCYPGILNVTELVPKKKDSEDIYQVKIPSEKISSIIGEIREFDLVLLNLYMKIRNHIEVDLIVKTELSDKLDDLGLCINDIRIVLAIFSEDECRTNDLDISKSVEKFTSILLRMRALVRISYRKKEKLISKVQRRITYLNHFFRFQREYDPQYENSIEIENGELQDLK